MKSYHFYINSLHECIPTLHINKNLDPFYLKFSFLPASILMKLQDTEEEEQEDEHASSGPNEASNASDSEYVSILFITQEFNL